MIKNKILWCGDIKTNDNMKYGRKEGEEEEKIELWRGGGGGGKTVKVHISPNYSFISFLYSSSKITYFCHF